MTERQKIDGKGFVKSLDECKTDKEVFGLLGKVLGSENMKDRAKNVSNLPQIVKLDARKALLSAMTGKDTSRQDCMNMAANKYIELTGKTVEQFKIKVNEYVTKLEMQKVANNSMDVKQATKPAITLPEVEMGG